MEQLRKTARGWARSHRLGLFDVGLTLGLLAFANASRWPHSDPGLAALLSLPQVLPLTLRRRAPLGALAVMVASSDGPLFIWNWKAGGSWAAAIAIYIGMYSVADPRHARRRLQPAHRWGARAGAAPGHRTGRARAGRRTEHADHARADGGR